MCFNETESLRDCVLVVLGKELLVACELRPALLIVESELEHLW